MSNLLGIGFGSPKERGLAELRDDEGNGGRECRFDRDAILRTRRNSSPFQHGACAPFKLGRAAVIEGMTVCHPSRLAVHRIRMVADLPSMKLLAG